MANPYSKYTGARVQPVPSDYYRSLGKIGEMYERGIASVGKAIGGAIESHYEKKAKHEALDEQYEGLQKFLNENVGAPKTVSEEPARVNLPAELGGGQIDISLEQQRETPLAESVAKFEGMSLPEKAAKVKDMLFLRDKFFKDRDFELREKQYEHDKASEKARKEESDRDWSHQLHKWQHQVSKDTTAANKEERALSSYLDGLGATKQDRFLGHRDPGGSVSLDPTIISSPIFEEYYPGVESGIIPNEGTAYAMGLAPDMATAKAIWETARDEQWRAGEHDRELKKAMAMAKIPSKSSLRLSSLVESFKTAGTEEEKRRMGADAAVALMENYKGDTLLTVEDGIKYLQDATLPAGAAGAGSSMSPTERQEHAKLQHAIVTLGDIVGQAEQFQREGKDYTGFIPTIKSKITDEFFPAIGIDKFAVDERIEFRSLAGTMAQNLIRTLNQEGRLSDMDAKMLYPLVPKPEDDYPVLISRLRSMQKTLLLKLQIQTAGSGKVDVFSLSPEEFLTQVGKPNEKAGGAITVPAAFAPSVISLMPQYKYIGGDRNKPVTAKYIAGLAKDKKISREAALLWIQNAGIALPKK